MLNDIIFIFIQLYLFFIIDIYGNWFNYIDDKLI